MQQSQQLRLHGCICWKLRCKSPNYEGGEGAPLVSAFCQEVDFIARCLYIYIYTGELVASTTTFLTTFLLFQVALINVSKAHRLNDFGENAQGRKKLEVAIMHDAWHDRGTVDLSLATTPGSEHPHCQAWAELEGGLQRGFASYICFRARRNSGTRTDS